MKKITLFLVALLSIMTVNAATETVYFVNANNWTGTIKAHLWGGTAAGTAWSGNAMTKESEQIAGFDVYSYSAEAGAYANVIFNNGSAQTADLTWTAGKYYVKDGWYTKDEAVVKLGQPIEYETVYFVDAYKWGSANIYTWQPEVGTWPGKAMTKESEQIAGYDVYSYTVEKGTSFGGLNFNCKGDNSKKTGDLTWTAGKYYVKDAWYTKEEAEKGLLPSVKLAGTLSSWDGTVMELSDDYKTASLTLTLAVGEYELKIIEDGAWLGNEGIMERGNSSDWVFEGEKNNCKIAVDIAGEYVFTWTLETNKLTVTYPAIPAVPTIVEGTKLYVQTPFEESASASRPHKVVFGKFTVPTGGSTGGGLRPMAASTVTEVEMTKVYTETGQYNIWEVTAPAGTQDSIFNVIVYRQSNAYAYIVSLKYDGEKNLFKLPNDYKIQTNKTGIIPATEADGEWDIYKEVTVEPEVKYTIVEGTKLYVQTPFEESASASRPHKVVFGNFTVPTGGSTGGGLRPMAASTVTEVEMTKVYTEAGQYNIWEVTAPAGTQDSIFNVIVYKKTNPCAYIVSLKYDGEKNLFKLPNDYKIQTNKTGIIPATEADGEWDIYVPDYTGGDATNVDNATVTNIFVQNGMIVMDGEYQIYTITGQNVTDMNGSLENGVYVVKSANAAVKVIVK